MTEKTNNSQAEEDTSKENNVVVPEKEKTEDINPAELIANLPDDMPSEMKKMISMSMMHASIPGGSPRSTHPLFEKFTEDHVHKYLDYIQRDDDNEHKLRSSNRWFSLGYTVITIAFFSFLIIYLLPKDKSLLNDILKLLFTFAGGVGSGYGLRSYIETKK